MKATAINTRIIQMEVLPGRPRENTRQMLAAVARARRDGIELLVFPELCIPGYLLGDEWERSAFLRDCEACGHEIRQTAVDGLTIVFGNVGVDWNRRNEDGRVRKYNACFVAEKQTFLAPQAFPLPFAMKTLMPNYREFDDSRHFYDARKLAADLQIPLQTFLQPIQSVHARLGALLCEDAWNTDSDYTLSPMNILAANGAELFVNLSCSPFTRDKNHKRNRVFSEHARQVQRPMIYANCVGIQNNGKTIYTFDGASCIYDGCGNRLALQQPFQAAELTAEIPLTGQPFGQTLDCPRESIAEIHLALEFGTRRFLEQLGNPSVTIGISGGIDSAVAAALYARIVPPEKLLLINMPSRYNSRTTRKLAAAMAANLGCYSTTLPIEDSVNITRKQLDRLRLDPPDAPEHVLTLSPLQLENIQARDRSSRLLAAAAAAFGGVFTCNANKTEMTVGYTTLYGDLGGFLANLADLWKGEVYRLARYLNEHIFEREVIPAGCLEIVPSAELSSEQNIDQGQGDPLVYPYHDRLFASWVEFWNRLTPEEILSAYADRSLESLIGFPGSLDELFPTAASFIADLERWWALYQGLGVAKRIQAPPVLAVTRRAFGFDHREAQIGPRYSQAYLQCKQCVLNDDKT